MTHNQDKPVDSEQEQPKLVRLSPDKKPENVWVETGKTIAVSVALALGIRTFIVEPRYIPSGSMLPTLQINDRLLIEKVTYYFHNPKRGDIVVFNPTENLEKQNFKDAFIKRVIGVPGDRIEIKNGKVYVDGKVLPENYLEPGANYTCEKYACSFKVPKDQYLVMGDNRNNSYDGRYWGYVPKNRIIGRANVRIWPFNRLGAIGPQPEYYE
jgi:signal peptidase I